MALANKIFFHWERTFLLSHVKLCFCMRWNYLWQREILRFQMCILHLLLCESCLLGSGTKCRHTVYKLLRWTIKKKNAVQNPETPGEITQTIKVSYTRISLHVYIRRWWLSAQRKTAACATHSHFQVMPVGSSKAWQRWDPDRTGTRK